MELDYLLLLFAIGFLGSFLSGMVGIGGAIVKYPLLLTIPPLFGFQRLTAHEVSGISALDVLFVSIAGVLGFRKGGYLDRSLILTMGFSMLIGSSVGSLGSQYLSENQINIVYGLLALLATIMMFLPKKDVDDRPQNQISFNKSLAAGLAFAVGISSGIVGVGGGFLLIPIMLHILRIPTRITIASSLAITFISSIASSIGKITTGQMQYLPAIILILAGVIAAPLGAKVSTKINTKLIENILAAFILSSTIRIWMDLL